MDKRFRNPMLVLLLVATSFACSMLRTKRPLTWRLTREIDAPASGRDAAMRQTIAVMESRLKALGISSFDVKPQGDPASGRILLSLPDSVDRERLKRVITAPGKLELVHVITPPSPVAVQTYATREAAVASLNSGRTIPTNRRVLPYTERADLGSAMTAKWVVIESPAIINGSGLRNASAVPGNDDYEISFSLRKEGADKFGSWTGANIDQYLGVVLNDEVKSIAFIKSQISDQGVIEGRFTKQAAEDLALILKSGLPFPVKLVGES